MHPDSCKTDSNADRGYYGTGLNDAAHLVMDGIRMILMEEIIENGQIDDVADIDACVRKIRELLDNAGVIG